MSSLVPTLCVGTHPGRSASTTAIILESISDGVFTTDSEERIVIIAPLREK